MNLIIMMVRINAILPAVLLAVTSSLAVYSPYDLERIKTIHGRVYQNISILDADEHGLLFRHHDGIAKIAFETLPINLRMLYEVTDTPVESPSEDGGIVESGNSTQGLPASSKTADINVTIRTRISFPLPVGDIFSPVWLRYLPYHNLTHPVARDFALRELLFASGLYHDSFHAPCYLHVPRQRYFY